MKLFNGLESQRGWIHVLQTKRPQMPVQTTIPSKMMDGEKIFHNKTKFKKYLSALQKALEGKLQLQEVNHTQEKLRNK